MKKKFFPLWFINVINTEEKLMKLSGNGLHLSDMSYGAGIFTFENGKNKKERYRICLAKNCGGEPPKGLAASGWKKVCGGKNYYVVKNPDPDVENVPSYEKWKSRVRISLYIAILFLCFGLGMCIGYLSALSEKIADGKDINIYSFIFPAVLLIIGAIFAAAFFISNRKLAKTDTDLGLKGKVLKTVPKENFIYSPEEEKQMLKDGRMIKKAPLGWFYAPDKAEKMVEKMGLEGWKFYRFNELGTILYFVKSEPCRIKFVVDYQNESSDEYFASAKEDGWKLEFTSVTRLQGFIIWTKEYGENEDEPEFYSDNETRRKHARRMALTFGLTFLLCISMIIFSIAMIFIDEGYTGIVPIVPVLLVTGYTVLVAEFGFFASKTIGFYIRTKRKYDNKN